MFTISVETSFWASHQLTLPDGSKEHPHWHNWLVSVKVAGESLNKMGLLMDFGVLKKMLEAIVAPFRNVSLETIEYFQRNNSSAEMAAKYIYEKLELDMPKDVKLMSVKIVEEPFCSAKFSK